MASGRETDSESLRLLAATALERGLGFVEAHGDDFARLRARVILQALPPDEVLSRVAAAQRDDGSFAPLGLAAGGAYGLREESARGLSEPLLGCLEAMIVLSDLTALSHPCLEATARHLGGGQLEDGSWGRVEEGAEERLFATAMLAGLLGRTRFVRPEVLERAGGFVGGLFTPERVEERDWRGLVAFGVFFSGVEHDLADGAQQWVGRALERGFRTRSYGAAETLRMLLHCGATAVPGASLAPHELLAGVLAEQGPDGGFDELAEGGVRARVSTTVDCLQGIIGLCQVLG
jgi:hypothetical protein